MRRVAAANAKTVVVVNSGMPVLMPWAEEVAAILQVWLPGQAFGEALAGVLLGAAEPGGRLPVTLPRAEADSPVLQADPQAGELAYDEGFEELGRRRPAIEAISQLTGWRPQRSLEDALDDVVSFQRAELSMLAGLPIRASAATR